MIGRPRKSTPFPNTRLFQSRLARLRNGRDPAIPEQTLARPPSAQLDEKHDLPPYEADRKSTRLNSSHANISYAVFCLKKKKSEECHTLKISALYPISPYQHT